MPGGNKPLTASEYKEYNDERKRLDKKFSAQKHTLTVCYKSLCATCAYNADNGKRIIHDCVYCRRGRWKNCSPRQVRNGEILKKLEAQHGNIEWIKAYNPDRTLAYEWKKHESKYEQGPDGKWVPKE